MATFQLLVDEVLPYVPAAPEAAAITAYRKAAREFFRRTLAWRTVIAPAPAIASLFALTPGTDIEVFDIAYSGNYYGDHKLTKVSLQQYQSTHTLSAPSTPVGARIVSPNVLELMPGSADDSTVIKILAYQRPTVNANTLDDEVAHKYGEQLEYGAIAYLLRQPRMPWTDYEAAREYEGKFQYEIDRNSVLGPDGGVGTARSVRYGGL